MFVHGSDVKEGDFDHTDSILGRIITEWRLESPLKKPAKAQRIQTYIKIAYPGKNVYGLLMVYQNGLTISEIEEYKKDLKKASEGAIIISINRSTRGGSLHQTQPFHS